MAKSNGGIIGPDNIPTGPLGVASGVWRLQDATKYQGEGLWPIVTGITYPVANSLRFNDGSSDNLQRTPGSTGNSKTFTWSSWVKISTIKEHMFFTCGTYLSTSLMQFYFNANGTLTLSQETSGGSIQSTLTTNRVFRDVSAWYHIVIAVDTTQATDSNRVKLYINGVQETSFSTATYPPQNTDFACNTSGIINTIGNRNGGSLYFDGYMSEVYFIDGQALTPTDFGETDTVSGNWKAKAYAGSYGTNGFYLNFQNSGALGTDSSGNANNFTVNNLTAIDQTTDTPTNNFATLNYDLPLFSSNFSEGNCKWTPTTASEYYWSNSTFGLNQGKWYMEAKLTTAASHNYIGISVNQPDSSTTFLAGGGGAGGANALYEWGWKSSDGKIYNNTDGGTAYGDTYTTGDILGMYLDLDNNKLYFAKNGTIQNSGTGISITDPASTPNGVYFPCVADGTATNSSVWEVNFGNPTFTISSGNSDANGYGNFEYDPSVGTFDGVSKSFYALNTMNLNFSG